MENEQTVIEDLSFPDSVSSQDSTANASTSRQTSGSERTSLEQDGDAQAQKTTKGQKTEMESVLQNSISPTFRTRRTASFIQRNIVKCNKKYKIKLARATLEQAKKNEGTLKRISWSRPGKYFLRTDKPKLLSFRNFGPDKNQISYKYTGFENEKTYIRLNFAPVQSYMSANILVFIHGGEPPRCPDDVSPDDYTPEYNHPVETLLFEVTYTFPERASEKYINWKLLRKKTKFTYVQLRQLYDQFMYDTRQNGHCGRLFRKDFGRVLQNFSLINVHEDELSNLWFWFTKHETNDFIEFSTFVESLGRTWHDVRFFGLSNAAREALKEEEKYAEIDEQDKKARERAIHDAQLQDVATAYSRLTGSPIPPSPSHVSSSNQEKRSRGNSTLSQISTDPMSPSNDLDRPINVANDRKNGSQNNNGIDAILMAANNDTVTPNIPVTPQDDSVPQNARGIKSPVVVRPGEEVNFSKNEVENKLQDAYDTVVAGKAKDTETLQENNMHQTPNATPRNLKTYASPDISLASLYKDHPLARTFVRACSMSPMTPELMDSLANAFASELVESAMFKANASPVVPLLDLTRIDNKSSDNDSAKNSEDEEEETKMEARERKIKIAKDQAERAFKKYDKDGKFGIDSKEFEQICVDLGVIASKSERKEALNILDKDGNGYVGKDEFISWYTEMKTAKADEDVNESDKNSESSYGSDFVPSVLKDVDNANSMDISQVANLANVNNENPSTWIGSLIVTIHSANELIIPATAKPFVRVEMSNLLPELDDSTGEFAPREDIEFLTSPCEDAFDVKWDEGSATFKIDRLLSIPDMEPRETPANVVDALPLYGNGEISFKVDCGLDAGIIGTAILPLQDLHGKICNTEDKNIETHGLKRFTVDLKPPVHLRTSSLDGIGTLEVSVLIQFERKIEEVQELSELSSNAADRTGVREGFGQEDASLVASKLRIARKKSGIKVTDLFKSMDREHRGSISRDDFVSAVISLGVDLSREEASLVFDFFNVHKHKRMVYTDFVTMMMSAPTGEVKTLTEKRQDEAIQKKKRDEEKAKLLQKVNLEAIVARIRTERRKREILPQALYDKFDVDNSGAISKDELILALNRWNFSHTEDEIDAIYAVYAGEDGMMDYSEFLTFITGGTSKSGKRVKRAIHPNHRPAGDMQDDGEVTTEEEYSGEEENEDASPLNDDDDEEEIAEREKTRKSKERKKRQKRFRRQRSIGFADPTSSYVQITIYGGENLALDKRGKEPKRPEVHIKPVGLRSKKLKSTKGSSRSPLWNFKTNIGKSSKAGIGKLQKLNLKVKDGTRVLGVVDIDFNITQFSRSTEERMKYPLLMHRDQETYEDDDKRLGFIDVGLKVISKVDNKEDS